MTTGLDIENARHIETIASEIKKMAEETREVKMEIEALTYTFEDMVKAYCMVNGIDRKKMCFR
tara:strand:+ start:368 stop:556 length:189 start_codon:yes stop_codon:yes gene_type:complete